MKSVPTFFIIFSLVCLGLLPKAHAVSPPPDGGYSGGNTAEGQSALFSLTSGFYNTAVGIYSLLSLSDSNFNTGVVADTLLIRETRARLLARGALLNNINGTDNTAVPNVSAFQQHGNRQHSYWLRRAFEQHHWRYSGKHPGDRFWPNVAVGWQALENNTIAGANTAVGYQALHSFTTGPMGAEQLGLCTAVGFQALANATDGFGNSGFGYRTLMNSTGPANTAIGFQSLLNNPVKLPRFLRYLL